MPGSFAPEALAFLSVTRSYSRTSEVEKLSVPPRSAAAAGVTRDSTAAVGPELGQRCALCGMTTPKAHVDVAGLSPSP